jgi:uncharacterized membrane protein YphA (DoxX/SURF4 family)
MSMNWSGKSKAGGVAVWVLSILMALFFLVAGVPKLLGVPAHVEHFATWRYPDWFRLVVGTVEVISAILLLIPRFAYLGAAGIAVIMLGATYTHVLRVPEEAGRAPLTLTLLALALLLAYARRPRK